VPGAGPGRATADRARPGRGRAGRDAQHLTVAWDHLIATAARIAAGRDGPAEDGLAKVHAAQVGYRVVTRALDLHGGRGYLRHAGVEKWWRDVAAFFHSDGANRALLIRAARAIRARPC